MTRCASGYRRLALAAGLAAPLLMTVQASAESAVPDAVGSTQAPSPASLQIVKTQELHRFQERPYLRIPVGAAFSVRAPTGLTAADLHNLLRDCATRADESSPLCIQGAELSVERRGGTYVVKLTSDNRSLAREIQRRAAAR